MPGHPPSPVRSPHRILVRGVNWLGDAVMSAPALERLRERFPEAHITLLAHAKLADLWEHHPALDALITFRTGEGPLAVARRLRLGPAAGHEVAHAEKIRREPGPLTRAYGTLNHWWEVADAAGLDRFDVALVLPTSARSALEVWLARVPHRVGYAHPWRNWLLTQAVAPRAGAVEMNKRSAGEIRRLIARGPPAIVNRQSSIADPTAHHVHQYLHLAAALGAAPTPLPPRLEVTDAEVREVARKFGLEDTLGGPYLLLGLNPGAEYGPAKRWPPERFIEAAVRVQQRVQCRWLIFGGPKEAALAERIAADVAYEAERPPTSGLCPPDRAAVNLASKTSLRELMALLKACRVLLTNDTGPMHLAAALGTSVVAPFGSTSPALTGPGQPGDPRLRLLKSDAPCAPCFRRECPIDFRCLTGISAAQGADTVLDLLKH